MKFITSLFFTCGVMLSLNAQECVTNTHGTTTYSAVGLLPTAAYYFDVTAEHDLVLNDLSLSAPAPGFLNAGIYDVYSVDNTYNGKTGNVGLWTHEGQFTGNGSVTALGLNMRHFLHAGESRGFAIVVNNASRGINVSGNSAGIFKLPTTQSVTSSNAKLTVHGAKSGFLGTITSSTRHNPAGDVCYTPCYTQNSFTLAGLTAGWVNAGANDLNVYYAGITTTKRITAKPTNGSGNYSYEWSTTSGTISIDGNPKSANLIDPTTSAWVHVTITDEDNGCHLHDSVYVERSEEYACPKVGNTTRLKVCRQGTTVCVPWSKAVRDSIFAGTLQLGECQIIPSKASLSTSNTFSIYPNPSNGFFTISFEGATSSTQMDVLDLNGRVLLSSKIEDGTYATTLDLSNFTNGLYIVKLASANGVQTEKVQILH